MKRRILSSLKLSAIAAVDNPCQEGARMSIMKRRPDDPAPADVSITAVAVAKYIGCDDGAHTFTEVLAENKWSEAVWPMTDALTQSIRSIMGDSEMSSADRESQIASSVQQFLNAVREVAPDAEKRLVQAISKGKVTMKTIEELTAEVEKLTGQLTSATALVTAEKTRADTAETALKTEQEGHATTKAALVEATDEVIEIGSGEGVRKVHKSKVGEDNFAMFKAQREEADLARAEKRASDELGNLPGTPTAKARVLMAIDRLPEDDQKTAKAIFTAAQEMAKGSFVRIGSGGEPAPTAKAAETTFMAKVSDIETRDKVGKSEAMSRARREFPDEFAAYQEAQDAESDA